MRNLAAKCLLQNIHRKYHVGTKQHVKMISNPLLTTMQQKLGRDRNSSKQLEKEREMMMELNLQVIGSKD
jgi:hypothetical protein